MSLTLMSLTLHFPATCTSAPVVHSPAFPYVSRAATCCLVPCLYHPQPVWGRGWFALILLSFRSQGNGMSLTQGNGMSLTLMSLTLHFPATCKFAYVVHAPVESSNSALYSDLLPFAIPNLYGGGDGSRFNLSFPEKRDEHHTDIATLPCYVYICTCGSQSGLRRRGRVEPGCLLPFPTFMGEGMVRTSTFHPFVPRETG